MYIKIYFGEKPVFLCDDIDSELNKILHHPDAVFVDEISSKAINAFLHEIIKEDFHAGIIWNQDLAKLIHAFFKHFTLIEAAGGIVENSKKELLFIYRLSKWDLPKGKIEKNESAENAAVREIEEETGVQKMNLRKKITETYHVYNAFGKHFLKKTHWYHLKCNYLQNLIPQTEESITDIKWISPKNLKDVYANTYPSIKDVLALFVKKPAD